MAFTLGPRAISAGYRLAAFDHIGSTNAEALSRARDGERGPIWFVTSEQTAGRGRAGRSWLSAPGASLTFSIAWPFFLSPQSLLGLPLVIGVALAQALSSLDVKVQLKWPNDVLKDGKKLAGVLIETVSQPQPLYPHQQQTWAVIGIGLNLLMPEELEQQIDRPVAEAAWLAQMDRNQLLAKLMHYLAFSLRQFSVSGFGTFVPIWNNLHAYAGQQVDILDQGKIIMQGRALGVDGSGCLMLQDQYGSVSHVTAGDVSLRPGHVDLTLGSPKGPE